MTCLSEAKNSMKGKQFHSAKEYDIALRKEFTTRFSFTKSHYFDEQCDIGCPCSCWNENLNSSRTRDTPKDRHFTRTFQARAMLSTLRRNSGPGAAIRKIWVRLGGPIGPMTEQHFNKLDKEARQARERQNSKKYKARQKELSNANKTTLPPWEKKEMVEDIQRVPIDAISTLHGTALDAQMRFEGLALSMKGENNRVEGK